MVLDVNVLPSMWTILGVIASFFVAGVAVTLAWRSNRQLYRIRQLEKKESGIQEIIHWAVDVEKFTAKQIAIFKSEEQMATSLRGFNELLAEALYLRALALKLFPTNGDLLTNMQNLRERIDKHIRLLILIQSKKVTHEDKATATHGKRLIRDGINLINLATHIYTEIK